jgi:hypothetical protein
MIAYDSCMCPIRAERMASLIPDDSRRQAALDLPTRSFEMAYRLDCRNLCADFCEDIEFRFSFGISALVRRFLGKAGLRNVNRGYSEVGAKNFVLYSEFLCFSVYLSGAVNFIDGDCSQ